MANIGLIILCLALGFGLRNRKCLPPSTTEVLNAVIIYVSIPALAFTQIHDSHLTRDLVFPVLMPWIVFLSALAILWPLGRKIGLPPQTLGVLVLMAGLGNTSFVGFPLIEALMGNSGMRIAVMIDQLGSFMVLSTLGIATAASLSGRPWNARTLLKSVLRFPPFFVVVLALLLHDISIPAAVSSILDRLALTLAPLALISVGAQIRIDRHELGRFKIPLALGLGFKLLFAPLFIFLIGKILNIQSSHLRVTLLESAMAPMISAGVIAEFYGLDGNLASWMLGLGVPLSLLTVPTWDLLLGR